MTYKRLRTLTTPVALLTTLGIGFLCGGLAISTLVSRTAAPVLPDDATEPVYAAVTERSFGRDIPITIRADWAGEPLSMPLANGIITRRPTPTFDARDNLVLLEIDDEPVVVAIAETVMYRSLSVGSQGEDVKQLQDFLERVGILEPGLTDGTYRSATAEAVKAFNQSHSPSNGQDEVPLGRILFLPPGTYSLPNPPVTGQIAPTTLEMNQLSAGGPMMTGLVGILPELATGQRVYVDEFEDPLVVADITADGNEAELILTSANGGSPCPSLDCPVEPASLQVILSGRLELVAEQRGLSVPVSALYPTTDGGAEVIAADSRRWPVKAVVVQAGFALIEGLPDNVREVRIG